MIPVLTPDDLDFPGSFTPAVDGMLSISLVVQKCEKVTLNWELRTERGHSLPEKLTQSGSNCVSGNDVPYFHLKR